MATRRLFQPAVSSYHQLHRLKDACIHTSFRESVITFPSMIQRQSIHISPKLREKPENTPKRAVIFLQNESCKEKKQMTYGEAVKLAKKKNKKLMHAEKDATLFYLCDLDTSEIEAEEKFVPELRDPEELNKKPSDVKGKRMRKVKNIDFFERIERDDFERKVEQINEWLQEGRMVEVTTRRPRSSTSTTDHDALNQRIMLATKDYGRITDTKPAGFITRISLAPINKTAK